MIRKTRFIVAMAVVWPLLLSPLDGQELEDLVDESEREEEKLRQIPGANLPGVGAQPIPGKVRLPKGEDVDVLRISQDRAIDPESYVVGPGDVLQLYIWGNSTRQSPFSSIPKGMLWSRQLAPSTSQITPWRRSRNRSSLLPRTKSTLGWTSL